MFTRPDVAAQGATREIRPFRLADYGLIDVGGAPRYQEVQRALLWEWSASPAGVIIWVNADEPPDDSTVRAVTSDAARLVRTWPGTPIGLICGSRELREHVAQDPQGRHLVIGMTLTEIWDGMWSRGGKANITIELPPTMQAPVSARDLAIRACSDWNLTALAEPAGLLACDLVARSVTQGAQDIHFTVSRHHSRIRILTRDDIPSTAAEEPNTIHDVFRPQFTTRALSGLAETAGEFALAGHHVRWAVARDPHVA